MAYPSDVKEDEWTFVVSYRCLMSEDAPQREYALRDVFSALRYLAHPGCPWRYLPGDLPPGPRSASSGSAGEMPACPNLSGLI